MSNEAGIEDVNRLIQEVVKSQDALQLLARRLGAGKVGGGKQTDAEKDQEKATKSLTDRFRRLDKSADSFLGDLEHMSKNATLFVNSMVKSLPGGAMIARIWDTSMKLSNTYKDMAESGATFHGSMLEMAAAAGAAGLPLAEFAAAQKKYNATIYASGGNFFQLNNQLRKSILNNGMYGYTTKQLIDFQGQYLNVSRLNGSLQSSSTQTTVKNMGALALNITALAEGSDHTREEIMKMATAASEGATALAQVQLTAPGLRGIVDNNMKTIAAGFASLNGEAGQFFSKFFGDSFGGMANLTDGGQTAINAGMGQVASEMDQLAAKVRSGQGDLGDSIEFAQRFKKEVNANLPALQALAIGGNDSAKKMIEMASSIQVMTQADIEKAKEDAKNQGKWTAFFGGIEDEFQRIVGAFKNGFFKNLNEFKDLKIFGEGSVFEKAENVFRDLGKAVAQLVNSFVGSGGMSRLAENITNVGSAFLDWIEKMSKDGGIQRIWTDIKDKVEDFATILGVLSAPLKLVAMGLRHLNAGAIKLIGGLFLAYKAAQVFAKLAGAVNAIRGVSTMTVKAGVVNVEGAMGGGAGGAAAGAAEEAAEGGAAKAVEKGLFAKSMEKIMGTGIAKAVAGSALGRGLAGVAGLGGRGAALASRFGVGSGLVGGAGKLMGGFKGLGIGLVGGVADYAASNYMKNGSLAQKGVGIAGRTAADAATGAMIGSVIPGLGTGIGALAGGAYGLYSGWQDYGNRKADPMSAMKDKPDDATDPAAASGPDDPGRPDASAKLIMDGLKSIEDTFAQGLANLTSRFDTMNNTLRKVEGNTQY